MCIRDRLSSVRLLSIMSVIYRRWAALRLLHTAPWAKNWATHHMCGTSGGLDAESAAWAFALSVEHAELQGRAMAA
eukprot:5625179-Alexandrium_andersonii.AAC.1